MTIQQVVALLQQEKQANLPSRYPCRAIMVKNVEQYCQLLSELKKISDIRVVQSSEIFPSFDVMPQYDNLKATTYQSEWVVLTGVSEYLRLFSKKEAVDHRFASLWSYQAPASSTGRIIIPLWGCEAQWFDSAINLNGDLRQQDFYYDCSDTSAEEQKMNLLVLSGMFEQYISKLESMRANLKIGLQEWFEYWENPSPENGHFVLLTKRCNSIITTSGNVSVHVIKDTLSFIRENMHGAEVLTQETCTDEMQSVLFEYALKGAALDDALIKIFNVSAFSGLDIMGKWNVMPRSHKELVALWLKLHPDNTYLCHCFAVASGINEIADCLTHDIFKVRFDKPEWVAEWRALSTVMSLRLDKEFFEELSEIPEYETRLDFISSATREERIYLLRMVGNWLRKDPSQVKNSGKLREVYPALFAYLCYDVDVLENDLSAYFSLYKAYKLENTLPADENTYFSGVRAGDYDYRYAVLSNNIDTDTTVLWVDALGIEWLPLLKWTIDKNCDGTIRQIAVTQAILPTETCFNEQWTKMEVSHTKLNKLDKLAHKGVIDEPDYYVCIEEQLAFVEGICNHIATLTEKYHRVIITSDHGTSRLAARFFHTRDGIPAPKDSKVYSHGRYCEMPENESMAMPNIQMVRHSDGKRYAVFENYDHFKQSGFAAGADDENAIYGEVHGGATPEEMLVPVIVFDSNKEIPLAASWVKDTTKISMKKAKLSLKFNKPVNQLNVSVAGIEGAVSKDEFGKTWDVVLAGIKPDTYLATVVADGHIITLPKIIIKPALGGGDGDLP